MTDRIILIALPPPWLDVFVTGHNEARVFQREFRISMTLSKPLGGDIVRKKGRNFDCAG